MTNEINENSETKEQREQIKEFGSASADSGIGAIHCLTIVGQVEGHILLPADNKQLNTSM